MLSSYKSACDKGLNTPDVFEYIADCAQELGLVDEAILYFERGLEIHPTDTILLSKCRALHTQLGEYEKTVQLYLRAIEIDSEDDEILYDYAYLLHKMGQYEVACLMFEKSSEIAPNEEETKLLQSEVERY